MAPYLYACCSCCLERPHLPYHVVSSFPPFRNCSGCLLLCEAPLLPLDSVRVTLCVLRAPNALPSISCGLLEARKWVSVILLSPTKNKPIQTKSKSILLEKLMDFNQNLMLNSQAMLHALYVALGPDVMWPVS